ncbi:MAG: flagellar hook-associated protein FlgK [Bdellovibrionota bacterium]|jgi:flagellar hook-associated protein 1 FlgK
MSGYVSRILGTAVSGLNAQQAKIAAAANNISNVNTEGYVRRDVELTVREGFSIAGGVNVGCGVDVSSLIRQTNEYLEKLLREANGDFQSSNIQDEYLDRVESLFALTDKSTLTIGSALTDFFSAAGDLAVNPMNTELRANFIAKTENLCFALQNTYNTLASLQTEADERIVTEIETVNSINAQIADLNAKIVGIEAAGGVAADARDQRSALLEKLSEKMSFNVVERGDGSINITLSNGFSIVAGDDFYKLTTVTDVGPGQEPRSLNGGSLNYIVYDYSNGAGTEVVNLTDIISRGTGSLGGLLRVRGSYAIEDNSVDSAFNGKGLLVDYASRVEAITRSLLIDINNKYRALNGVGVSTAGDLDGNSPDVFGLFTFKNAFDDGNGVVTEGDLEDSMTAANYTNLSSIISIAFSDPSRVAAALADDPNAAVMTFSKGNGANMESLVKEQLTVRNFTLGNFVLSNATYGASYDELVSKVGNAKSTSLINTSVARGNLTAAQSQRDQQSAVSLDEEFVSLIKYQRAYQASARLLTISDELLQEVLRTI